MKAIRITFNPHRAAPHKHGSRRTAVDAAIAADYVPSKQDAIDAIRASKNVEYVKFQKPQEFKIEVCEKIVSLSAKMYLAIASNDVPIELLTIHPIRIWILCAIHRGIKMGIL